MGGNGNHKKIKLSWHYETHSPVSIPVYMALKTWNHPCSKDGQLEASN